MREVREAFRAITAEEEAATALIFALQRRRYPRANELDSYKHAHKAGLTPFLRAIESIADSDEFGHLLRNEFVRGRVSFRRMTIAW